MVKARHGESRKDSDADRQENEKVIVPEVVNDNANAKNKDKRKVGRPNHDHIFAKPVVQNFIQYLVRRNASDREIARQINVPITSFHRWKKKNEEFWNIEETTDENEISKVRRSLVERATGGFVERPLYDKDGALKGTKFQYYPASDTAIFYYLNNRDPSNWKSKVEHNHAIEELPLEINFVRASDSKKQKEISPPGKAVIDDYGNEIKLMTNEREPDA